MQKKHKRTFILFKILSKLTLQYHRQWFNDVDLNQVLSQPIMKSKLIKRPQNFQLQQSTIKIKTGNNHPSDTLNSGQLLLSGPVLDFGLKKHKTTFQSNNPYQVQQGRQNSIRQSSAKSSRSFNGYQQINQFELKQRLGKGAFSQVYEGIDVESPDKKKYAIKIMQSKRLKKKFFRKSSQQIKQASIPIFSPNQDFLKSSFRNDKRSSQFVNNQIALLKKIDHQFITKLYQVIIDKQKEYCQNGFICQNKKKTQKNANTYIKLLESQCKRYFKQLALAINYIHTVVKIAHRDIKPQNILLSKNDQVKLSDFGLGTDQLQTDQYSGTKLFMPPESSEGRKIVKTQSADIWAMGVTLFIMLTGYTPDYKDNKIVDLHKKVQDLKDISPQLRLFLSRCLQVNPQKRMTSQQMLSDRWITGDDPFFLIIQKNLVKQFQIAVTKQQQSDAIKDVQIKKPKQKSHNLRITLG